MPRKRTTKKKAKSMETISETHGKVENEGKPTTLDQIWGDTGLWKYSTMNLDDYQKQLNEMNKTDLQAHAKKVGLVPIEDRRNLNKRLISEFKKHVSAYTTTSQTKSEPESISKEAKKILSEGR